MEGKDEEADPRRFSPLDFPSAARATFFDERECAKEDEDEEQQGQHRHPVELLHHHNDLRQHNIFYNSMEGRVTRNALHQQERRSRLVRDRLEFNISPPAIPRTATRRTNLFPLVEHLEQQQVGQFDEQAGDQMNVLPSPAVTISQHPHLAELGETSFSSLTTTPPNSSGGSVTRRCSYDTEASGSRVTPLNLSSHLPISTATGPVSYSSATNPSGGAAIGTDRISTTQNVYGIHTSNTMRSENYRTYTTVGGSLSAFTSSRRSLPSQYPRQIPAYEASPDKDSPTLTDDKQSASVTVLPSSFINVSQPSSTLGSPFSPLVMGSSQLLPQDVPFVFTPVLAEDTAATSTTDELMFCLPVSTNDSIDSIQHGMTTLPSPSRNRPSSGMSSIDETLSSSTETETIGRGRSLPRQSRRTTRRGSRGRVPSPGRGRSSSSVSIYKLNFRILVY